MSIVERLIDEGYNIHFHTVDWTTFGDARNFCMNKALELDSEWCIMPDIDEFFNCNAPKFFNTLDTMSGQYNMPDIIQFFHVKCCSFDQLYFRTPPNLTTYYNDAIFYSIDKSTMRLFKKPCFAGFIEEQIPFEFPSYIKGSTTMCISLHHTNVVQLDMLADDFFMIHYDRAKLDLQSTRNNTSIEFEEGKKRLANRRLKSTVTNGKLYTTEWANSVDYEDENDTKAIEELGRDQYIQSVNIEGHIFPDLPIDVSALHCKELREYLEEL